MKKKSGQAFDPSDLDEELLGIYLFCVELTKANEISADSLLGEAQGAAMRGDTMRAIDTARKYLLKNDIDLTAPPAINHGKVKKLRLSRDLPAKELARLLNVSPSAVCQFEKSGSALSFVKVLITAEHLQVDPRKLFVGFRSAPRLTLLEREESPASTQMRPA